MGSYEKKHKMKGKEIHFLFIFLVNFSMILSTSSISIGRQVKNAANGNREKLSFRLNTVSKDEANHPLSGVMRRFRRQLSEQTTSSGYSPPKNTTYLFNDGHYVAEVHWSGGNSSSIMILMKDPSSMMSGKKPSHFYVSNDYGVTFNNRTDDFKLSNGSTAVISDFFSSAADHKKYILVAKFHKRIFVSRDDCRTFRNVSVSFFPNQMKYHPRYSYYVLGHESEMGQQKLYVSTNNGRSWRYKSMHVKSYFWGYAEGFDRTSYIYYHRDSVHNNQRKSEVRKTSPWSSWWALFYGHPIIATNVVDFILVDQYMFITKNNSKTNNTKDLFVSISRGIFRLTEFPVGKNATSYIFADSSENETMVAVSVRGKADLYVSGPLGVRYSLSLSDIVYHNKDDGINHHNYETHDYVDLHKVEGISGIYIATNRTGKQGPMKSWITYDKGGEWSLIPPPENTPNCTDENHCSLHLSQEYGYHNPYRRYTPIYSRESAPGFIMATGNTGDKHQSTPSVYFSRDAGLTWKKLFDGNFWYSFVDHGGVIVVLQKYGLIDSLQYSWNEGKTWSRYRFSTKPMRVYGLKTEPGEKTTIFTLFGSYSGLHSWVLIQVDVRGVLGKPCNTSDYKSWKVIDQRNNTSHCILGKEQIYDRRRGDARCFNGYSYTRPNVTSPCECEREDFMCDYGFKEWEPTWWYYICIHDTNFEDYSKKAPSWCKPGLLYNISSGYRKVPGDECINGLEQYYSPTTRVCPVAEATNFLFYAKRRSIHRYNIDTKESIAFQLNGLRNVIALEMDYKNNILFYADITADKIVKMDLKSGNISELIQFDESRMYVEGLAYDWLAKNLFFCDAGAAEIGIIAINGKHKKKLMGPDVLGKPRAIAVHPHKGLMFWTDWGDTPQIGRSNMDGSKKISIIKQHITKPNGITIDYDTNRVYWADATMDRIESCDLNGNGRKVIQSFNVPHPYAITIYRDYVYWDDTVTQSIMRVKKDTGNNRETVVRWTYQLMDVKAFWPDRQKSGTNKCSTNPSPCKFICLPIYEYPYLVCSCPDGLIKTNNSAECTCPNGEIYRHGECKPVTGTSCTTNQFKCNNGDCIAATWKCDGERDCDDGSDESSCGEPTCKTNQFKCSSGRCILASWRCDGERDCNDGSDEVSCTNRTCAANFFKCPNGRCIRNSWRCDGDNDCSDNSDEQNCGQTTRVPTTIEPCDTSTHFKCTNTRCVSKGSRCNAIDDCTDASDEMNCDHCQGPTFKCNISRQCILSNKKCNLEQDCHDGSDEEGCYSTRKPPITLIPKPIHCDSGDAYCVDRTECYPKKAKCDGQIDCFDGSDEEGCPSKRPSCSSSQFQCTPGKCIPKARKCDGKPDCASGIDEKHCPGEKKKCLPYPFGFTCAMSEGNCYEHKVMCDGHVDCGDSSDEISSICHNTSRVIKLKSEIGDTYVILHWKAPADVHLADAKGYILSVYDKEKNKVTSQSLNLKTDHTVKNLKKCSMYHFAIAINNSKVTDKNNLYVSTGPITTIGMMKPKAPSQVKISDDNDVLFWKEIDFENKCYDTWDLSERSLWCNAKKYILARRGRLDDVKAIMSQLLNSTSGSYKCFIQIIAEADRGKKPLTLKSKIFKYHFSVKHAKQKKGKKRSSKTLIWGIPVGLVLVACLFGLGLMVYKYRRLQNSFLAFAARSSYTRQENDFDDDDDDNMVVGFRSGEEAPMINRFSDDDPLVVG